MTKDIAIVSEADKINQKSYNDIMMQFPNISKPELSRLMRIRLIS